MQIIKVTYTNEDIIDYDSFDNISDFNLVSKINCASNKLTSLPDNMNFPNLREFLCSGNNLTKEQELMKSSQQIEEFINHNRLK